MTFQSNIMLLIVWTVIIYCIASAYKRHKYHKSDIKFFRIYSGVHDLEQLVNQLEEIEEIQTSIELARFHRLKGVTIQLPDNLSHDHEHTLLINGHDSNSKILMQLVIEERERLRKQLTEKIHQLEKHGTTQLNPIAATKEIAAAATMRTRGAHFSKLKKKIAANKAQKAQKLPRTPKQTEVNIHDYEILGEVESE